MLLIAPLSAHTMAKIVFGLCDNLLSLVVRCWNFNNKVNNSLKNPIVVCPAMNTLMYENPLTTEQIDVLKHRGITVLGPV
jgi:phosphopantothenoylcysteine decarboxylase